MKAILYLDIEQFGRIFEQFGEITKAESFCLFSIVTSTNASGNKIFVKLNH